MRHLCDISGLKQKGAAEQGRGVANGTLGLRPTFAKCWERNEGVPMALGHPQILLDEGECLGQASPVSPCGEKLHLWLARTAVVLIRSTSPAMHGCTFWCQALALLKS